jgi:hypothetical protein
MSDSAVDEMFDIGTGLNDSLGCVVAAIFYLTGLAGIVGGGILITKNLFFT